MTGAHTAEGNTVHTVLGPVPADELGVVSVHEALLSVVPGAEHAFDITMDRAEIFETLAAKLTDFREHGGRTIVDSTGMFHGRDVKLYEALSRTTGVHIVASTGMGPENPLGGYFLTPQTNPPTPWPAEKFADLFTREITEGMVVPRVERRGAAGLVTTAADPDGMTATEESLFRGAARTALATGVAASIRYGNDAVHDLGSSWPRSCRRTASSSAVSTARTRSPPAHRSRSLAAEPSSPSTTWARPTTSTSPTRSAPP